MEKLQFIAKLCSNQRSTTVWNSISKHAPRSIVVGIKYYISDNAVGWRSAVECIVKKLSQNARVVLAVVSRLTSVADRANGQSDFLQFRDHVEDIGLHYCASRNSFGAIHLSHQQVFRL